MDLSLRNLIQMGRRWWWLLVLAPLLAGLSAYWTVSQQTDMYSASATVEINPPTLEDTTSSYADSNIVATYRELITTSKVLLPFIEANNLSYTESELRAKISTSPVANTRLMRISVSDPDPAEAARLANGIANQFALFAEARTQELTSPYRNALNEQIADVEAQITATQAQIDALNAGPDANSPETQADVNILRANLSQLQGNYSNLLVTANEMDLAQAGAATSVVVAQEARVPSVPYAPKVMLYTLLGLFAGGCIAVGAIALFEYMDNTVKVATNFNQLIGAPLLSVIGLIPKLVPGRGQLFVLEQPQSNPAESMRLLRTNVEFAAASREIASMTVSSAGPGEGKSTVTANLAAAMAQAGFSVVIIDADLRRPSQHKIFGVPNDRGLTTLLTHPDRAWRSAAIEVIPNLWCVPSGPLPPNPSDLLSSDRFRELIDQTRQTVDIVLVDTPPVLAVSDPLVVSTATDGILLVSRAGHTRIEALERAAAAFPETVRRIGVVLNQQERSSGEGYYYYGYYYGSDERKPPTGGDSSPGSRLSWPKKAALDPAAPTVRLE